MCTGSFRIPGLIFLFALFHAHSFAQPFIDPLNFSAQVFHSEYKDSLHTPNARIDYNLNFFLPKKFKNGNVFLLHANVENLHSLRNGAASGLYAFCLPVGFLFKGPRKKWKTLVMAMPKIASDLRDNLSKDVQYGGTVLFTWESQHSDSLKLKFGLYYNRECFGNFFVPLIGIDWKPAPRLSVYGILPNNMRVEYKCSKKIFAGIGYKNYQRSYRLSQEFNNDFVWARENQVKMFAEFFILKHILLTADVAHTLNYQLVQYRYKEVKTESATNPVYTPVKNNFLFTLGLAYRIRLD